MTHNIEATRFDVPEPVDGCICQRPHGGDGRFVAKYKTDDERRIANNKASRKYRELHRDRYLEISRRCKRHRDPETRRISHNRASATFRTKKRALVHAAKSVPCVDCGKEYPPYVMDFDHVRGNKKFTIGEKGKYVFYARL